MALPPIDRVFHHGQSRRARRSLQTSRGFSFQHLPDGEKLHRTWKPRQLDCLPEKDRVGSDGDRQGKGAIRESGAPRRSSFEILRDAARSRTERPQSVHLAVGSAGLPDRDEVRQRAHQDGRHGVARHPLLSGCRQELSRGLLCRQNRAGFSPSCPGHVRASGPSE